MTQRMVPVRHEVMGPPYAVRNVLGAAHRTGTLVHAKPVRRLPGGRIHVRMIRMEPAPRPWYVRHAERILAAGLVVTGGAALTASTVYLATGPLRAVTRDTGYLAGGALIVGVLLLMAARTVRPR